MIDAQFFFSFFNLASLRALCIADSIKLPEAECSLGIGTAIKIPVPRPSSVFASDKFAIFKKREEVCYYMIQTYSIL